MLRNAMTEAKSTTLAACCICRLYSDVNKLGFPRCGHGVHLRTGNRPGCLDMWLAKPETKNACAVCRKKISKADVRRIYLSDVKCSGCNAPAEEDIGEMKREDERKKGEGELSQLEGGKREIKSLKETIVGQRWGRSGRSLETTNKEEEEYEEIDDSTTSHNNSRTWEGEQERDGAQSKRKRRRRIEAMMEETI